MTQDTIIRHPKERLSKCSLQPLVERKDLKFIKAKQGLVLDATGFILLDPNAPEITADDAPAPVLLLDSTWQLLPDLLKCISGTPILRSLPQSIKTAYPRVSKLFEDPHNGLASVEALYLAKKILGHDDPTLLDHYHWKDEFLAQFK